MFCLPETLFVYVANTNTFTLMKGSPPKYLLCFFFACLFLERTMTFSYWYLHDLSACWNGRSWQQLKPICHRWLISSRSVGTWLRWEEERAGTSVLCPNHHPFMYYLLSVGILKMYSWVLSSEPQYSLHSGSPHTTLAVINLDSLGCIYKYFPDVSHRNWFLC